MEKIKHFWNLNKHLAKFNGKDVNSYRIYCVQRCKELSDEIELPKQNFGSSNMCSHCGSLWSKNEHKIRIKPGRACSKSVKKIIKFQSEENNLSRFHASLLEKSLKNKNNKIVIKCSVCLKNTETICDKPARQEYIESEVNSDIIQKKKKKKKKNKDKSAGLNLSLAKTSETTDKEKVTPVKSTPISAKIKKRIEHKTASFQKVKKLNLNKLNSVLNQNKDKKPKNSLTDFLKELY